MEEPNKTSRANRRHHRQRLKSKRRSYFVHVKGKPWSEAQLGILIDTPQMCSCAMCGNPRRKGPKEPTRKELEARLDMTEQLQA